MTIGPFRDRVAMVDQRSLEFLRTLIALGGYCTAAHAKQLGVAGSGTRTRCSSEFGSGLACCEGLMLIRSFTR
jgi:hypothetical protein